MSLATNLADLSTRIATQCKALKILINGNAADLSALTTTNKTNLVAAINELDAAIDDLSSGAGISDGSTSTATTWSSSKITTAIAAAKSELINGAGPAFDTLSELAALLEDNEDGLAALVTQVGLKANSADVGDTTTNFVSIFEAGL